MQTIVIVNGRQKRKRFRFSETGIFKIRSILLTMLAGVRPSVQAWLIPYEYLKYKKRLTDL